MANNLIFPPIIIEAGPYTGVWAVLPVQRDADLVILEKLLVAKDAEYKPMVRSLAFCLGVIEAMKKRASVTGVEQAQQALAQLKARLITDQTLERKR